MSFFNRHFFVGLAAGVGLTVALIAAAGLLLMLQVRHRMDDLDDLGNRAGGLAPPPLPVERSLADFEWKLQGLDGEETSLAAFKGKVLFVNLWATWCGPCVVEMPSIQRLYEQFQQEDVKFLLVSDEPPDVVEPFVQEKGWELPMYVSNDERPSVFESRGIPATFILDREGRIVFRHVGSAQWDDESSVRFLNELLEKKAVEGDST
ncbi:MAG: TlpA disulfide reductase family protein [Candidatus Aminicenantes bacterium]|nr:TlpA disulfide reductase family protein [Candidatus Aminicenantes bacterium]